MRGSKGSGEGEDEEGERERMNTRNSPSSPNLQCKFKYSNSDAGYTGINWQPGSDRHSGDRVTHPRPAPYPAQCAPCVRQHLRAGRLLMRAKSPLYLRGPPQTGVEQEDRRNEFTVCQVRGVKKSASRNSQSCFHRWRRRRIVFRQRAPCEFL